MKMCILVILAFFLPQPISGADCVCVKEPHPSAEKIKADRMDAYEKARAVFVGQVIALDDYRITLSVKKLWKGDAADKIVLSTGAVTGYDGSPLPKECAYHQFRLGREYLVYANGPTEKMEAEMCLTMPVNESSEEEKGLDHIKPHKKLDGKHL